MNISFIIPHYKTWKLTLFCIFKLLKHKGNHNIEIYVVDNNASDETIKHLWPFKDQIKILSYPTGKLQSHGIAIDFAIPYLKNEWFVTLESDSFPTKDGFIDYYEQLVKESFDSAGSLLQLSGGEYVHPCGALYRKSLWQQAKRYCESIPYSYFPNIAFKDGHYCHLMVHHRGVAEFCQDPDGFVTLNPSYCGLSTTEMESKLVGYKPVCNVFHNGMGRFQESFNTYGQRTVFSEPPGIALDGKQDLIYRMGYEPGQWFCYWMLAAKKNVYPIPTQTVWMPGRENQQQEYTLMENGLTHIWGGTSYADGDIPVGMEDIYKRKREVVEELYTLIPETQKPRLEKQGELTH